MKPDITFLTWSFKHFNHTIFNDELTEPALSLNNNRTRLGQLSYRVYWTVMNKKRHSDIKLSLSCRIDREPSQWEDTLIHEMIHLYILQKGLKDTSPHGKIFKKIMMQINSRHNRNINIFTRLTSAEFDTDRSLRQHYICLCHLPDEKVGIASVASTRIYELWHKMQKAFPDANINWFITSDPYFNRFRRIITPKLYIVSDLTPVYKALSSSKQLQMVNNKIYVKNAHGQKFCNG